MPAESNGLGSARFHETRCLENAAEVAPPVGKLKSQALSPLKVMQTFKPVSISQPKPGVYVADFGQNFSGWVEIAVMGQEGSKITLSPAELLKEDGTANQKWTGSPVQVFLHPERRRKGNLVASVQLLRFSLCTNRRRDSCRFVRRLPSRLSFLISSGRTDDLSGYEGIRKVRKLGCYAEPDA